MSGVENDERRADLVRYWLERAAESLDSARIEHQAGHLIFAVNRAYYACFYAAMALLLGANRRFSKHSGVLSEFHRLYVKTGQVPVALGKFYQEVFYERQRGDYTDQASFEPDEVAVKIDRAKEFVECIRRLAESHG